MLSQDELDAKGTHLTALVNRVGVTALNDDEAKALYYFSVWKDGADWKVIEEYQTDPFWDDSPAIREQLTNVYGFKS